MGGSRGGAYQLSALSYQPSAGRGCSVSVADLPDREGVEVVGGGASMLCHVHQLIGVPQQAVRIPPVLGKDRNADTYRDGEVLSLEVEAFLQRCPKRLRGPAPICCQQQDDELVTSDARHVSDARRTSCQERLTRCGSRSPAWCPKLSLTSLK